MSVVLVFMLVIFACSWIFLFAYSDLSLLDNPPKNNRKLGECYSLLNNTFFSILPIFTDGSKEPVSHTVGIGVYTFPNLKYKLVVA